MKNRYNQKWPEQARAKWAVEKRAQRGTIVKPTHCQVCGKPFPSEGLTSHHKDYHKPFDVVWCCQSCHTKIHKELGRDWKEWTVTQVISLTDGGDHVTGESDNDTDCWIEGGASPDVSPGEPAAGGLPAQSE